MVFRLLLPCSAGRQPEKPAGGLFGGFGLALGAHDGGFAGELAIHFGGGVEFADAAPVGEQIDFKVQPVAGDDLAFEAHVVQAGKQGDFAFVAFGVAGDSGKWPWKNCSLKLTFLKAFSDLPGSAAVTRSSSKKGKRCGRSS